MLSNYVKMLSIEFLDGYSTIHCELNDCWVSLLAFCCVIGGQCATRGPAYVPEGSRTFHGPVTLLSPPVCQLWGSFAGEHMLETVCFGKFSEFWLFVKNIYSNTGLLLDNHIGHISHFRP